MTTWLDLDDPDVVRDPYPVFAELRAQGRPVWDDHLGVWLAATHAHANAVLRTRTLGRVWADRQPADEWETFNWLHSDSILETEPPTHTRLRSLVAAAFARGHVERLRPVVGRMCEELLDEVDPAGFDLVADYAEPLPVLVIAELLGVPEADRPLLRPWSQAIVKMYEPARTPAHEAQAQTAAAEFAAYAAALADERRRSPGDDLVSHLVQVEARGDRLSARELVATVVLLLNAGHEASVNGFGNGMVALLRRPGLALQAAARPVAAAEELLRFDTPSQLFERTATAPTPLGGVVVETGQKVAALLGSANRDGAVFADPDVLDVARDPNPHLSFGAGIHFCLGAPLARVELQTSLPALLRRFPRLHLAGEPVSRGTFVLRGWEGVPVAA